MDAVLRMRRFIVSAADRLSWLPPTLARVAIGVVFVGTGWGKLLAWLAAAGPGPLSLDRVALRGLGATGPAATPAPAAPAHN